MASNLAPGATAAAGTTGTDFKQRISDVQEDQFTLPTDFDDRTINTQPLEAYLHYAAIEREREVNDTRPIPDSPWTVFIKTIIGRKHTIKHADFSGEGPVPAVPNNTEAQDTVVYSANIIPTRKRSSVVRVDQEKKSESKTKGLYDEAIETPTSIVTDEESERAYRALRVASWQAVFYLITTDILGFTAAPETFQELGYGPGVLVYCCFYLLAVFGGQVIWKMYMSMDSSKFPVTCYADLGERTFGRPVRHIFNFFQSFQLLFNVALLIIGNGQVLVVMIKWQFCYLALNIFFMLIGMLGGQIRSLRNFSWFANINIWLNITTMILTIVGIELYKPIPSLSYHKNLKQPVDASKWVPPYTHGWYHQVSGVQLAIFAYGGAMIFPEFMAEMRRPRDFWKSALCAQLFCFLCYMFFGLICYARQGQYSSILPNVDFANQTMILVNNVINLTTVMVAAVLYGNIGVKVFYQNVLRAYFKAPSLLSTKGRWAWSITVISYWAVAWLIGTAIPNLTALITLVGASCILQFTYTFPPILLLGFWMQLDAMKADNPWVPGIRPGSNRIDTWRQKSRWVRGFRKYWYVKVILLLLFLASCANCGLGIYAGIEEAISTYKGGYNIPFSCTSPNDPSVENS